MRRMTLVLTMAVLAGCGGGDGGGDGGDTSPRAGTPTPSATATPLPTPAPGEGVKRNTLRRCVSLWNRDVRRADDKRAQAMLGKRVGDGEKVTVAVTEYDGLRLKARRSSCVVVVAVDGRAVPPFSPVKGGRTWESACSLVRAKLDRKGESRCTAYSKDLLAAPNVTIDDEGRLSAR